MPHFSRLTGREQTPPTLVKMRPEPSHLLPQGAKISISHARQYNCMATNMYRLFIVTA
jgi:hypothetical protein